MRNASYSSFKASFAPEWPKIRIISRLVSIQGRLSLICLMIHKHKGLIYPCWCHNRKGVHEATISILFSISPYCSEFASNLEENKQLPWIKGYSSARHSYLNSPWYRNETGLFLCDHKGKRTIYAQNIHKRIKCPTTIQGHTDDPKRDKPNVHNQSSLYDKDLEHQKYCKSNKSINRDPTRKHSIELIFREQICLQWRSSSQVTKSCVDMMTPQRDRLIGINVHGKLVTWSVYDRTSDKIP